MIRQFGDVPPLTSNVGIATTSTTVTFPDNTLELLASEYPTLAPYDVAAIYVLPETEEWHVVWYRACNDRHCGTILMRLYLTDDRQIALVDTVNDILRSLGELDRLPNWAKDE